MKKTLIVIVGPTGIGKTDLSIEIAKHLGTEIISSDSRQIFKELKIGTAVPEEKYLTDVRHHFIGSSSIHDYYNASMFEFAVVDLLKNELFPKYNQVLMVGGSMMYIDAVCRGIDDLPTIDPEIRKELVEKYEKEGIDSLRADLKILDPEHYKKVDLKNPKRMLKAMEVCVQTGKPYSSFLTSQTKQRDFNILKIGLERNRDELYHRINCRVNQMMDEGLLEEARRFYPYKNTNALNTVGYKEIFEHFDGKISLEQAVDLIKRDTRRYAKRQITWFKRENIPWFHPDSINDIITYIDIYLNK